MIDLWNVLILKLTLTRRSFICACVFLLVINKWFYYSLLEIRSLLFIRHVCILKLSFLGSENIWNLTYQIWPLLVFHFSNYQKPCRVSMLYLITEFSIMRDSRIFSENRPSFLAQLMSCRLKLSLCDHPLSGVHPSFLPSFLPSVNTGCTDLNGKTYRVQMWSVDTLGDWLLAILELGHSDLLSGFYRAKFTFPMSFNGNKICL